MCILVEEGIPQSRSNFYTPLPITPQRGVICGQDLLSYGYNTASKIKKNFIIKNKQNYGLRF